MTIALYSSITWQKDLLSAHLKSLKPVTARVTALRRWLSDIFGDEVIFRLISHIEPGCWLTFSLDQLLSICLLTSLAQAMIGSGVRIQSFINFSSVWYMMSDVCHGLWQMWHMLITQPKIRIMTQNFQDMFLRVCQGHSWRHGWPCPPCLRSRTLNFLQVSPFLTPPSWCTSN